MTVAEMVVTPSSKIQRTPSVTPGGGGSKAQEEKILVTVRARPLNRREQTLYDLIAWDFPDEHSVVLKNPSLERHSAPYTFDKVFSPSCSSQKVYEEGARDVALSVLNGINATIFAYGQTSSGKTFTMRGITENVVKDIYEHITSNPERAFLLKVSALEIYNETVVDLLKRDGGSLRLLDDPEKGTLVDKLVEVVVKDRKHLSHLIATCEAQRQVGETALNDKSSRSHQIFKLTVESSLQENSGCMKSFRASLNLVDLAGSERTSQTYADGARLKEGSHINRSLLTLTTVIRKLSGGGRNSHIPYRDSKLTRILQPSLGGNARTAIVCTMSPSLRHIEQTRNTLSFATSAKEVTNTAQVNMVVPDKRLVKHLQKEVARLEAELRGSPGLSSSSSCLKSLLMEKDMKIQQMEREMKELKRQRDLAQSQLEVVKSVTKEPRDSNEPETSRQIARCLSFSVEDELASNRRTPGTQAKKRARRHGRLRHSMNSTDTSMIAQEIRKLWSQHQQLGKEADQALELFHKLVASHKLGNQDDVENIANVLSEIKEMQPVSSMPDEFTTGDKTNLKKEISRLDSIALLEDKLENVQKSIDKLVSLLPDCERTPDSRWKKRIVPFASSNRNLVLSPCPTSQNFTDCDIENKAPGHDSSVTPSKNETTPVKQRENSEAASRLSGESSRNIFSSWFHLLKSFRLFRKVLEMEANEAAPEEADVIDRSPVSWASTFEDQRKQIVMLWHLCHVSIIHRTQFYMLFKGDPEDGIYIEVELRRLNWLEQHLAEQGNASPALLGDEPSSSVLSSIKALKQEREYLARRMSSKLTAEEREALYDKWEIEGGGKERRQQLVNKVWKNPYDMKHVEESAEVVAKLVGFCESGEQFSKEMFELNFVTPTDKKRWMGWNLISNLLHL